MDGRETLLLRQIFLFLLFCWKPFNFVNKLNFSFNDNVCHLFPLSIISGKHENDKKSRIFPIKKKKKKKFKVHRHITKHPGLAMAIITHSC